MAHSPVSLVIVQWQGGEMGTRTLTRTLGTDMKPVDRNQIRLWLTLEFHQKIGTCSFKLFVTYLSRSSPSLVVTGDSEPSMSHLRLRVDGELQLLQEFGWPYLRVVEELSIFVFFYGAPSSLVIHLLLIHEVDNWQECSLYSSLHRSSHFCAFSLL